MSDGVQEPQQQEQPPGIRAGLSLVNFDRLVFGSLLLVTFLLCVHPLMDTDFWWHLRTGQLIWERGTVPRTDWFLFTDSDRPWIDLHWGFQLLITALHGLGGVNLVIFVKAAVLTAVVAIGWSAAGRDLPAWLRALLWVPAVICITGRGYERPEMLSQLFLALWLWIAFRVETQPKWVWALPAIQVVWINCHALFVLGLVVGGCYAVDFAARKLANGRFGLELVPPQLKPATVAASGVLCGLAALASPYLVDGALFPFVLYRKFSVEQEFYSTRIGEFQQPADFFLRLKSGWESAYLDAQIVLFLLTLCSLLLLLVYGRRWSPFRWLLCLGFGHLAWEATRNVNISAIVATVALVANVADVRRIVAEERRRDRERESLRTGNRGRLAAGSSSVVEARLNLVVCVVLLAWIPFVVTGRWGRTLGENKVFGLGERPWWFAHEAIQFAGEPGFPDRALISHIGLAGVYEFHHGPEKKVFMDPRLEVVRLETFALQELILQKISQGDRSWELILRDKQGRLPVLIFDSRNSRPMINGLLMTPGWRLVHADPAAAVFLSNRQADELDLKPVDPTPLVSPP